MKKLIDVTLRYKYAEYVSRVRTSEVTWYNNTQSTSDTYITFYNFYYFASDDSEDDDLTRYWEKTYKYGERQYCTRCNKVV